MSDTADARAIPATGIRFLGMRITPLTRRRLQNFRANKRGFWSLWIFLALFALSLFAEFIANNRPFIVTYDGQIYFPVFKSYPETAFGGDFPTEADYLRQLGYGIVAVQLCNEVIQHLLQVQGGNGLREGGSFERRYRDFQAMSLHINAHPDRVSELVGKYLLGLANEAPFQ